MSDQGEKIIHLAREVLRSGHLTEGFEGLHAMRAEAKTITIKAAALAALLAALGGAGITHLIEDTYRPANRYERVEIDALMLFAAKQNAMPEETLRQETLASLSLTSTQNLTVQEYIRVREYLRDRIR